MKGPQSTEKIYIDESETPELLWITGYEAVMKGADGKTPQLQDFMCHSNLDYQPSEHRKYFGKGNYVNPRLFTLSQGQFSIKLPEGFGIPYISNQPMTLNTQVLNHNIEGKAFEVRHKVAIHYVKDKEAENSYQALFPSSAYGLALVEGEGGYYGVENPDQKKHGPGCLLGTNASGHHYVDDYGRKFTGHWVVKPGREVNKTLVTKLMNLPYDTMIHYIAVHLHPFAESLELIDRTTEKSLFKSQARNLSNRIGLEHVDYFSSSHGIPVYKDHEYELISIYNNTTKEDQDSMAVMYLYLLDKDFHKPSLALSDSSN